VNTICGACLASSAIRCSFVKTLLGLNVPDIFPSNGSVTRCPLPSPGFLWVGSPGSAVLRGTPTSDDPSLRASFPSLGGTARCSRFAPHRRRARRWDLGLISGCPSRTHEQRSSDLPGSWGTLGTRAALSDPDEVATPGHFGAAMLPSANQTASALVTEVFRGCIARPASSLCTLRSRGRPRSTQHSVPAGGHPYRTAVRCWVPEKVSVFDSHPPSSKLCLAHSISLDVFSSESRVLDGESQK